MIALLALAAAQASIPPAANEASATLAQCVVAGAQTRAAAPDPAEAIADAALAACAAEQQRLWDALAPAVGAMSDAEKGRFLEMLRTRATRIVNERRGLVRRQENEATAVGDCIRGRAAAVAVRSVPEAQAVDDLLDQCRAEGDALRARLVRDRGETSAERVMSGVLTTLRTLALQQIQQARASGTTRSP